ncbi:TolC family protein [Chitinophaga sedimenti]|uniref:TolC family protein n=1 Tax=Chitinophaga sedimenti TaxID=2033606 RepID=UPI00200336C9|nr:TolC family protein [Chitinophaga sedimenti]MCK7554219.1 TolC family protein [Chitinophaga sedimenti]
MRITICIFITCLFAHAAAAQLRFGSVQEIWRYADAHNVQLAAALSRERSAGLQLKQAKGALLPNITANGAYTDNLEIQPTLVPAKLFDPAAPDGSFYEATFGRRYLYSGNVNVQLNLLNTQNWFAVRAARLEKEISVLSIVKTKRDLYEQLANVYYTYLLATEAEELSIANKKAMDTLFASAQRKKADGLISQVTLNSTAINKEKAEKNLAMASQEKQLQLNALRQLLNTRDNIQLEETPAAITADTAFAADPDVLLAAQQVALYKTQWQSSRAAYAPSLSAVYQYNLTIAGDDFLQFNNTNHIPGQYWGLRLSLPVFAGNTRRVSEQKAKIDWTLSQQQYEAAGLQSQLVNENVRLSYQTAAGAYDKAKSIRHCIAITTNMPHGCWRKVRFPWMSACGIIQT